MYFSFRVYNFLKIVNSLPSILLERIIDKAKVLNANADEKM